MKKRQISLENQLEIDKVLKNIKKVLEDTPPVLKPVMNHLIKAEGKNIRADLIISTAKTLGGVSPQVINIATSVEILHLSTLVHDDIIDNASFRRGQQSVQAKFGKKIAVITGDYLFTKCFRLVAKNNKEFVEDFANAVTVICIGEVLQAQYVGDTTITAKEYFKIISGKTAALFALSTYTCAKSCGSDERTSRGYARIGYNMGMVFQLIDDCLDYEGSFSKTKKSIYKDLEEGIITYPLIYAIDKNPKISNLLKEEKNVKLVVDEVNNSGGIDATKEQAKIYYEKTREKIEKYCPPENSLYLYDILDNIYFRKG